MRLARYLFPAFVAVALLTAGCTGSKAHESSTGVTSSSPRAATSTPQAATSSPATSSPPTTAPATTPPATTAPAAPSATSGPQPAGSTSPAPCTASALKISVESGGQTVSQQYIARIHLLNTGAYRCTTRGYPGLAVLDASGSQVYQAVRRTSGYLGGMTRSATPPLITLAPGTEATATLQGAITGPTGASCPQFRALLITPPNTTTSVRVTLASPVLACSAPEITPTLPGATGRE